MTATQTRTTLVTAAVGAAIAGVAAPVLLFLSAGTANAIQDVSEHGTIAIIDNLPTPRDCGSCVGFNPQPDPPAYSDPSSQQGIGNPNDAGVGNPDESGLGGPDTRPSLPQARTGH